LGSLFKPNKTLVPIAMYFENGWTNCRAAGMSMLRVCWARDGHKLGHLLKGSNSHSPQGLMAPHGYANEIQGIVLGSLNFTAEDVVQIRSRLAQIERQK
jgi:hypothetical protein